jgi:hypothetical protein
MWTSNIKEAMVFSTVEEAKVVGLADTYLNLLATRWKQDVFILEKSFLSDKITKLDINGDNSRWNKHSFKSKPVLKTDARYSELESRLKAIKRPDNITSFLASDSKPLDGEIELEYMNSLFV